MSYQDTELCSLAHQQVLREFENVPDPVEERIRNAVKSAARKGHPTDHPKIRQLGGQHEQYFRLREGEWRAFLDKRGGHLRVLLVEQRKNAYREDNLTKVRMRSRQR